MAIIVSQDQAKATSGYFIPASSTNAQETINKAILDSSDGIVTIDDDKFSIYKINAAVLIRRAGVTLQATSPDLVLIQPINGAVCNSSDIKSNGNITVYGTSNVKIRNLSFNHPTCNGKTDGSAEGVGKGNLNEQRACVRVQNSSNVEVTDCKVKFPIYMDFCYVSGSSFVNVHDNYADKTGHALVQFDSGSHDCEAYNNWHKVFCNAGIRSYGGRNIKIYNNTLLGGYGSGQALIELRGDISNVTITKNILYACHFSVQNFVIQCDGGASPSQVHAADNVWWDAPGGFGQVPSAGNIQAPAGQQSEAYWLAKGYGPQGQAEPEPTPIVVTAVQKNAMLQMNTTLENSTTVPQFNYAENIGDGRGITFGCIGFCTGTYDGNILVKYYTTLNPTNVLAKYIPALNAIDAGPHNEAGGDGNPSVAGLSNFINDVKNCTDPLFKQAQLYQLDKLYYNPALAMANALKVKNVLTLAFIYDMCVRHGPDGAQEIIDSCGAMTNENTFLNELIAERDVVLRNENLGDVNRTAGYKLILSNVSLAVPFQFKAYGDSFTITGSLIEPEKPIARIGADTTSGYAPLMVKFTDISVNEVTRSWDFGDGGTLLDSQIAVHTFVMPGSYVVKLTVTNSAGSNSTTKTITVLKKSTTDYVLVSFDGTGQFNCKGTHNNPIDAPILELAMAAAKAANLSKIYLNGPHTYYVNRFPTVPDGISIVGKAGAQIVWNAVP